MEEDDGNTLNPPACYERLWSKGKHGKVALIAAANKLIRQAFAVITQDKPYIDGYVSSKK